MARPRGLTMAVNYGLITLNRAITYGAQVAVIGVDGLLDTFLPERREKPPEQRTASEMTDPSDGTVIE